MSNKDLKIKVRDFRQKGYTYTEIQNILGFKISKSTLSFWCKNIKLSLQNQERINKKINDNLVVARQKALVINKQNRHRYLESIRHSNKHYKDIIKDKKIAKLVLAVLYLGEGGKSKKQASVMLGNSDPNIIKLFLQLLRFCYNIDETKFRCTIQCRADQKTSELEFFWSEITKIPLSQFYKSRIDPRTIGQKSKKVNYKGVCRIDYFSAHILNELLIINETLYPWACSSVD